MVRHRDQERSQWPENLRIPQLERDVDHVEEVFDRRFLQLEQQMLEQNKATASALKNNNRLLMTFLGFVFAALVALVMNLLQNLGA